MWNISFIIRISDQIYERFKVTLVPFFVPDFNLLSSELDNSILHLTRYIESFYFNIILKQNEMVIPSLFSLKNLKLFFLPFQ